MPPVRTYTINSGCYRKGCTPANKGKHTASRNDDFAVKGKQGFCCRPVLQIAQDGTIEKRYPSVAAAQKALGVSDRHSITAACQHKNFCRGRRLIYEDEYVGFADYSWRRGKYRDIYGRLQKGHHANSSFHYTKEGKARKSAASRALSLRMAADPNNAWGKGKKKPVYCVTTDEYFHSLKDAAVKYGLSPNQVSMAISRKGSVHGYTFMMDNSR